MKPISRMISILLVLGVFACGTPSKTPEGANPTAVAEAVSTRKELPFWAKPYYLTKIPFSWAEVIPEPPAEGSEEDRKDLESVREWQKKRTKAQCEAAGSQAIPTLENSFSAMPGKKGLPDLKRLNPEAVEKLKTFFAQYQRDIGYVFVEAKEHWARKRPFLRDPSIQPCIKLEKSFAYPSGHAAYAAAGAEVLSELFPKNADGLQKAAKEISLHRILGGVHHPSDIEGGLLIGKKTVAVLMQDPKFRSDLEEVKKALKPSR